jgi:predicted alternative tryptophan synthase beta-subunit
LNFQFLKEVTLDKVKGIKDRVLTREEYLQLQEEIRQAYSTQHKNVPLKRIAQSITKILTANGSLEYKLEKIPEFDSDGKLIGYRTQTFYYFI